MGKEYLLDDPQTLKDYSRDFGLSLPSPPTYVLRPKDSEEIQKVVRLCAEHEVPIVPSSSMIHFRGGTIPNEGGVVLDLTRMDKILEIDPPNKRVRIEVGASWEKVLEELDKKELRIITPLLPHPLRSVVTDYLEREPPLIPIYEYGEPLLTMEVVWPNGDVFRTGSASVPYYPDSEAKGVNPAGPGIDFWRLLQGAQGTMGVVTWANLKVEYLPKLNKIFFIPFSDISETIEPIYKIPRLRIGQECFLLNNLNLALLLAENLPSDLPRLRKTLHPWILILIISGSYRRPSERIAYEEEALMELKKKEFPWMEILPFLPGIKGGGKKLIEILRKPWPKEMTYWKHRLKGTSQDLFFITRPLYVPKFVEAVLKLAREYGYPLEDVGCYIQPIEQSRISHIEFNFFYNPAESADVERVHQLYIKAAETLLGMGALFTRPYGELANLVYERATGYATLLKRVKRIFDPKNIMNPGKLCL